MCFVFSAIAQVHASDNSPQTNWGGVFKVPVEKINEVDRATEKWANWIKETHPLGPDNENNLVNFRLLEALPRQVMFITLSWRSTPLLRV